MTGTVLDDLGFTDPQTQSSSPAPQGGDPAVWTLLGENGNIKGVPDPNGLIAVGSTLVNRSRAYKKSIQDIATDPNQGYEAWQDSAKRAKTQKDFPVGSPGYVQAQDVLNKLSNGDIPLQSYTHLVSPTGQAADNRPMPKWADGSGPNIGGNQFYTLPLDKSEGYNALDDLGLGDTPAATSNVVNPADAADTLIKLNASLPDAKWPVYDPYNHVSRNKDGSIESIGDPATAQKGPNGELEVGIQSTSNPEHISNWLKQHPDDIANHIASETSPALQGTLQDTDQLDKPDMVDLASAGVERGLKNIGHSLEGAYSVLQQNPQAKEWANADLGKAVLARAQQDALLGQSPSYNLGKFGGEVAGTLPLMALTDGAAASTLSPTLNFLRGAGGGNAFLKGASLASGGALQGAEAAGLTSAGSSQDIPTQIGEGALTGAVLNPVLSGVANTGKGLIKAANMFTEGGRQKIIDQTLAQNTPLSADMRQYIPGAPPPTLAQATQNPMLAVAEKSLFSKGDEAISQAVADRNVAEDAAKERYVKNLVGTPQDIASLRAARDAATDPLRTSAFATAKPVDASSVVDTIDSILNGPAGKRNAVVRTLNSVRDKIATPVSMGPASTLHLLEDDPEQLYGVRKSIGDLFSPLIKNTQEGSDARAAAHELGQVKNVLDSAIETGAPGFQNYIQTYRDASRPLQALRGLQSLNLVDDQGVVNMKGLTPARITSVVSKVEKARDAPGLNDFKSLSDPQMDALYNLKNHILRSDTSQPIKQAGRTGFSIENSNNKGVVGDLINPYISGALGYISGHPVGGAAVAVGKAITNFQKKQLQRSLANRFLTPDLTSSPFIAAPKPSTQNTINPFVPSAAIGARDSNNSNNFGVQ